MNKDDLTIRGLPLRSTTRNPRTVRRDRSKGKQRAPVVLEEPSSSSSIQALSRPPPPIFQEMMKQEDPSPPAIPSRESTQSVPLPSPRSVAQSVAQAQSIYNCENVLDSLLRREEWIMPLTIVETQRNVNTLCRVPLCPYILTHVLSSDRTAGILPYSSLWIPDLPRYSFHLIYALKENVSSPNGDFINWVAVFLMHFPDSATEPRLPRLVGSITEERFVTHVQTNVQNERLRMRTEIINMLRQTILNTASLVMNTSDHA